MRELYPAIFKRKSVRRYRKNMHLSEEELHEIKEKFADLLPLMDDIPVCFEVIKRKETTARHGEYCICAYSKRADYFLFNVGYMMAQMDLYLAQHDIGACLCRISRPRKRKKTDMEFVTMLSIGKCLTSDFRSRASEFRRKKVEVVWGGRMDMELADALRLAPSIHNYQPWRIIASNDVIDIYQCKGLESMVPSECFGFNNAIAMGTALCFLDVAIAKQRTRWRREMLFWDSSASSLVKIASYQKSVYKIDKVRIIESLFEDSEEGLVYAALQGYMGTAYAEVAFAPWSAQIVNGDYCFFAGKPEKELVLNLTKDFLILMPPDSEWAELIEEVYKERAVKHLRYSFQKDWNLFSMDKLEQMAAEVPNGYELRKIDEEIYGQIQEMVWARDFCRLFKNGTDFVERGEGVVALKDGRVVSGASSYALFIGGIEVVVATKEEQRRKGLALACGAKLILECRKRNLFPNFNALDLVSVALAEKLGYHLDREYTVYEVESETKYCIV